MNLTEDTLVFAFINLELARSISPRILAIDQASCDLVFGKTDSENHDLVERIMSRHGLHQLKAMRDLNMGNEQYELICID